MDVVDLYRVSWMKAAVLAWTSLVVDRGNLRHCQLARILVTAQIPVTITIAGILGEFAAFVFRIFMKVNITQIHL